jgi:CBS domain-containing protein
LEDKTPAHNIWMTDKYYFGRNIMMSNDSEQIKNNTRTTGGATIIEEKAMRTKDIMKYGVLTVRKDTSVYEAIELLVERNISALPVVDDTGLVGILSEKDVLRLLYDAEFLPSSVGNYMTDEVVSFDEQDCLDDICNCLVSSRFRRVPILSQGKLTGIISRADLIKAYKYRFKPQNSPPDASEHKDYLLAKDVMKCGLLTIQRHAPIYEAMEIIATRNITGLPVVDEGMNLVGIVSEKDILKLLHDPKTRPEKAEDFMTEKVVTFNHDDSLFDVCRCLMNNDFRRVPILKQNRLVGIISRADIILYILKNKSVVFKHHPQN